MSRTGRSFIHAIIGGVVVLLALAAVLTRASSPAGTAPSAPAPSRAESLAEGVVFDDLEGQMREFMDYSQSISLTASQQRIKEEALAGRPAACCTRSSALTCCCPCNLSKSVWGLTHYLIAKKGYSAGQVEAAVADWMAFTYPPGYTGDACYTGGGCNRSPRENGCGGMNPDRLVL